ncbi:MAG TPA: hypothetical protein VMN38_07180 [Sphingomicrobium sp.]|nr:hypothetical protein [Sphingomicrobium sp.]
MGGYSETTVFTNDRLLDLRTKLGALVPDDELVVTCGSYARREAVPDSDLDFFSITSASIKKGAPHWFKKVEATVKQTVGKLPSRDGAFADLVKKEGLLRNFGGTKDTNNSITRRILFLLEGEYLTNEQEFVAVRRKILEKYVGDTPSDHQLAFYLLNDVVRYWRTLAVDYADKTSDASKKKKPWAIRNVKLVFSRKLIYASGLFSIALTADRRKDDKVALLEMLFAMTPIDRIRHVCGESQSESLLQMYDFFLDKMADQLTRDHLTGLLKSEKSSDPIFRQIKNEGHYFSRELMGLFHRTFHASHPIHMAVIF